LRSRFGKRKNAHVFVAATLFGGENHKVDFAYL
jgi:hypothetical protein